MKKAEKNYRRDYGRKDEEELVLNYSRDSLKEELDNVLETVNPDDLSESEKAYLNGRKQRKNHTLNIRFNDTEWEQICKQAELLKMKKSGYVRECAKVSHFLMISQDDMDGIVGAIRGLSANEDIAEMKAKLEEIWQLLNCIRSGVRCVNRLSTSLMGIRPEIIRLSELLCVRQNQAEQRNDSEPSESVLEVDEVPPKHSK